MNTIEIDTQWLETKGKSLDHAYREKYTGENPPQHILNMEVELITFFEDVSSNSELMLRVDSDGINGVIYWKPTKEELKYLFAYCMDRIDDSMRIQALESVIKRANQIKTTLESLKTL